MPFAWGLNVKLNVKACRSSFPSILCHVLQILWLNLNWLHVNWLYVHFTCVSPQYDVHLFLSWTWLHESEQHSRTNTNQDQLDAKWNVNSPQWSNCKIESILEPAWRFSSHFPSPFLPQTHWKEFCRKLWVVLATLDVPFATLCSAEMGKTKFTTFKVGA